MKLDKIQFDPRTFDDLPMMVWVVEPSGAAAYFNKATLAFAGYESPVTLARDWFASVHEEEKESYADTIRNALQAHQGFAIEYRRRNDLGDYRRVTEHSSPIFGPKGVFSGLMSVLTDISDRPPTASATAQPVELLSQVTHDMVWDWDLRINHVVYNAAFIELLGEAPAEYHAAHAWWRQHAHPDDIERILHIYEEAMKTGATRLSYEYRIRDREDNYVTLDSRACLMRDATGQIIRLLVASRDITNRRKAEEAQARLIRILEATTDYVGMATVDGHPFYINAAGRKMIGIDPNEPLDFHLTANHPDWANEILMKEAIPTAIRDGYWRGENALKNHDGREIPISQVLLSHRGTDGEVEFLSTIIRDLSERKRDEVERIEWANRYDAAIRASGQVLFDWNSYTNEVTYAGDMERVLGYTIAEMAGGLERFRQLIHPADLPIFDDQVQRVINTRDPFHLEFRLRPKNAGYIYVEAKGYFFLDRRGQIGRMVGFFADVTARHWAQEALTQSQETLEQRVVERTAELARASAVIEDRARQQEAVAQLGQRALSGLALGKLMDEAMKLVQNVLRVDCCSLLALTRDGKDLVVRSQAGWPPNSTGNRISVGRGSQAGYTLLAGEPVIVNDIAAEKRFTTSRAVLDARLKSGISVAVKGSEGPLGVLAAFTMAARAFAQDDAHFLQSVANVLTAAIQRERAEESIRQAREQAELASRAKTEFLSRMSHELRTPLNAILGFTQLMETETLGPSLAESVEHVSRAGKHLLSLINEVLDISRIDAGRFALSPEPIEVHGFLSEAIESIQPLATRHVIPVTLEPATAEMPPLQVLADRQRVHQVMYNILSNAVKYNRINGRVTVSYRVDGPRIRITIADTGRGIEPEKLSRLFLPFERLGAESTDIEGSGIGLALSRGIVNALHGELHVESRVGEGSTFWLTLPRADEISPMEEPSPVAISVAAEPAPPPVPVTDGRHTLLYIEDQDLNLRLVERILNPRPQYRLITATLGNTGLELARSQQPDLILLDLNLPDMTGDEVLHRLKSDAAVRHIPVIMVSADAMGERIEHLLRLGAAGYLTKPYKLDEFLRVIQKNLKSPH
ncbi:multi-sensor hybrid histidine kinase [Chthoniobacter flavus Ellin428]|uniref:histidine kinase n=1 Tax=Chthoniobacter flavus Ellin428 TaxID=497964 RepID=B4D4Q8_9BACT|nr:PAS domain-containing protein [Chthoniobacter flavus]EDY18511.1 multi-sensor hybrid histidine kinase [Chthoniobacter flavus Ellin428]TCO91029.1 PAS domain S-box-containing protein [Chthoniobacter flavus]